MELLDLLKNVNTDVTRTGHLMLKPEFVALKIGFETAKMANLVLDKIVVQADGMGLKLVWQGRLVLDINQLHLIYSREIETGLIEGDRLNSLTSLPTGHLLFEGDMAREKLTIIRGRVSCLGRNTCVFNKFEGIVAPVAFSRDCPPAGSGEKKFGQGCGIRNDLVRLDQIHPDADRPNDSAWNMVHASTPSDMYIRPLIRTFLEEKN